MLPLPSDEWVWWMTLAKALNAPMTVKIRADRYERLAIEAESYSPFASGHSGIGTPALVLLGKLWLEPA
jgi:hypothetical protein